MPTVWTASNNNQYGKKRIHYCRSRLDEPFSTIAGSPTITVKHDNNIRATNKNCTHDSHSFKIGNQLVIAGSNAFSGFRDTEINNIRYTVISTTPTTYSFNMLRNANSTLTDVGGTKVRIFPR